ncbi:hypothetical protein [Aquibium sp. ELW1220]|uniref:hypothetical protein n=1 Tax=Aquibium sp. ELW1220 TaxID=2976766 RepID=UPI0025B0D70C|nr:hypothetical protein [Aquibium sp. ELW1220]MDN2584389.1 hypothetical protein [Aquibium sp. ELW1220]
MFDHLLTGFDDHGQPIHEKSDEMLRLASLIRSTQRASINDLKYNFTEHMFRQGWMVIRSRRDSELFSIGQELSEAGKELHAAELEAGIMGARPLSDTEYDQLKSRREEQAILSEDDRYAYLRGSVERFYSAVVSPELIAFDSSRLRREAVIRFEALTSRDYLENQEHFIEQRINRMGLEAAVLRDFNLAAHVLRNLFSHTPM